MNLSRALSAGILLLAAAACDPVYGSTHCDLRQESPPRCQQRDGPMGAAFMGICSLTNGEPVEGACPDQDKVAGCQEQAGAQLVTDWYYRSVEDNLQTVDDVRALCDEDGLETVTP